MKGRKGKESEGEERKWKGRSRKESEGEERK